MHKKSLTMLLLAASMAVHAQYRSEVWCPDNGDGTYTNPVLNADYSDPDACAVGDDYYLTASSFNCSPGLPVLHSKDLVNWEIIGHAIDRQQPDSLFSQPAHGKGVWAPSIRHHEGKFYIYWGDPDQGVFRVTADNAAGPWTAPICVIKGKGMIDTTPLWDDDGRCYLVYAWANSRAHFSSILCVCELTADGTAPKGRPVIVFDGNGGPNHTCEGPKLYKRNGWYWIMCPAGGVATGFQLAMRSKNIYGPYESKTVLAQGKTHVNGPHQGAWVHTPYGEDWFLHFQDKGCYGRAVHLQPVTWKDNWPVMGINAGKGYCGEPVATYRKPKAAAQTICNPAESDDFNSTDLGKQWQWHANYDQTFGMPTAFGTYRVFTHPQSEHFVNLWEVPSLLLQKTPADKFTATTKIRLTAKADGQYGGLIMMGLDYSAIVARRVGGEFQLQQLTCRDADKGEPESVDAIATLKPTEVDKIKYHPAIHLDIYLRMAVEAGKCRFSYSVDGKNYRPCGSEFTMREGRWIGAKFGYVAVEPAEQADKGWIEADWIRITK